MKSIKNWNPENKAFWLVSFPALLFGNLATMYNAHWLYFAAYGIVMSLFCDYLFKKKVSW